jgi:hypothetical protein
VSISLLGDFSHDIKVVAPSVSFLNVLKSHDLVLFSLRKMPKRKKKQATFESLLPHISTTGALQDKIPTDSQSYSSGLQLSFLSIFGNWSCDHCPNILFDGP